MKIRPEGPELFRADGQIDGTESNSRFRNFMNAPKKPTFIRAFRYNDLYPQYLC